MAILGLKDVSPETDGTGVDGAGVGGVSLGWVSMVQIPAAEDTETVETVPDTVSY